MSVDDEDSMSDSSVFIQWKGTEACLDLHCRCGYHGHFDGLFAYQLRCGSCGRLYEMPHTFPLKDVEDDGTPVQEAWDWAKHPPRERDGPAEVTAYSSWEPRNDEEAPRRP